jgi:SAM-dependent methyltransferase
VLTVDYDRLGVKPEDRLLDLGCGPGRHTFEALRRGARVTAVDLNEADLAQVEQMVTAMGDAGEITPPDNHVTIAADATALPFGDESFDCVIAAEVLEHIPADRDAISEIVRVTRPGGRIVVTVPRRWPEWICWRLSAEYHQVAGGHVRIYHRDQLVEAFRSFGVTAGEHHYAHALHSPYWWLKCAIGVSRDHVVVRTYHRLLVWDLMAAPRLTRQAERLLNPILGKSIVLYFRKP